MLSREESFESIKNRLELLAYSISNSGSLNLNNKALHAENFYRDLLNLVYGWQLQNANLGSQNAADIDLADPDQKIFIQVTARNDRPKIADTLAGFHKKPENAGRRLKFMLIAKKAANYKPFDGYEDKFDPAKDIIDVQRLLREIQNIEGSEKLAEVEKFLETEIRLPPSMPPQKFYPNNFLPDLKYFVGREELLKNLESTLTARHKVSIHDISGLGKTFACYKFVAENKDKYSRIFFINCAKEAMMESLSQLGQILHPGIENIPQEGQALAVKNWLETNGGWLAIYDNVDLPLELVKYVPNQKKGDCIFTSNFADVVELGELNVDISKLGTEDSKRLLFNRREGTQNEEPHFNDAQEEVYFEKIVAEIDGLPLALATTGAFVRKKKLKFREFWRRFEKKEKVIIENEDGTGVYRNGSALRAFLVALEENTTQKEGDLPRITELVKLVYEVTSFISPDNMPEEFLRNIFETVKKEFEVEDADEYWEETRARLCDYDLFKMDENNETFSTHRLVQKTIQSQIPEVEIRSTLENVLNFLSGFFPFHNYTNRAECERYYQHTLIALEGADKWGLEAGVSATLYYQVGSYQHDIGSYDQAEKFYQRTLETARKIYGEEHEATANAYNGLAIIAEDKGDLQRAVNFRVKAMAINKTLFGEESPRFAIDLNNLAVVHEAQGKYDDAINLLKQAMEITEKTLGRDHPNYATRLHNLAGIYNAQGKYNEALKLYDQALQITEKTLGKDHPEYAIRLNNLGGIYSTQGKYNKAIKLYKQATEITEKALGKNHPDYAARMNNLAEVYRAQGKYDEAIELYKQAMGIIAKIHGKEHPYYASSLNNLGATYDNQGRYGEAINLYEEAMEITGKVYGKDHPQYAARLNNLAVTYLHTGKYSGALPLLEEALRILEARLPAEHPYIITVKESIEASRKHVGK